MSVVSTRLKLCQGRAHSHLSNGCVPSTKPYARHISSSQQIFAEWENKGPQDPAASEGGLTHLFVAENNAAITVQGCLEGEAAPVLPALEVDMVPLDNKDCPCGEQQRPGWTGREFRELRALQKKWPKWTGPRWGLLGTMEAVCKFD